MKTSNVGIALIKKLEGIRFKAYKCQANVWTIGFGHTAGVKKGETITQQQADALLLKDLARYENAVNKYNHIYSWTQNEFDALVSFAYNIGSIGQLTANGTRSKKVIASKMLLYCKANGKVSVGLVKRRKEEQKLFLSESTVQYTTLANVIVRKGAGTKYKRVDRQTVQNLLQVETTMNGAVKKGEMFHVKHFESENGNLWGYTNAGYMAIKHNNQTLIKAIDGDIKQ